METTDNRKLNIFIHVVPGGESGFSSEIAHYKRILKSPVVESLYISAKNISDFSDPVIPSVINSLRDFTVCNSFTEISIEVPAKSVSPADFDNFIGMGINRLSLSGITSLDIKTLKSVVNAAMQRFPNINADISVKKFKTEKSTVIKRLKDVAGLKIHHLSVYGITDHSDFSEIRNILEKFGYTAYDPFHFSLKGKECRYLANILKYNDYIGLGPAAHGCFIVNGTKHHTENPADTDNWAFEIEKKLILTPLSNDDVLQEYLLQNLTLIKGVDFKEFELFFDKSFGSVFDKDASMSVHYNEKPVLTLTESGFACTEHTHEGVARAASALLDCLK